MHGPGVCAVNGRLLESRFCKKGMRGNGGGGCGWRLRGRNDCMLTSGGEEMQVGYNEYEFITRLVHGQREAVRLFALVSGRTALDSVE